MILFPAKQGADFNALLTVAVTSGAGTTGVNLSGVTVFSQIRDQPGGLLIASFTGSVTGGNLLLSLPSATTTSITPGIYYFDVLVTDSSGVVHDLLDGKIQIVPAISVATLIPEGNIFATPGVTTTSEDPEFYTDPQNDIPM